MLKTVKYAVMLNIPTSLTCGLDNFLTYQKINRMNLFLVCVFSSLPNGKGPAILDQAPVCETQSQCWCIIRMSHLTQHNEYLNTRLLCDKAWWRQ